MQRLPEPQTRLLLGVCVCLQGGSRGRGVAGIIKQCLASGLRAGKLYAVLGVGLNAGGFLWAKNLVGSPGPAPRARANARV